jgi:hypothetical protein
MTELSSMTAAEELDRARDDYLAVSRGAHLYASPQDHEEAERRAWERLELALAAVAEEAEREAAGSA